MLAAMDMPLSMKQRILAEEPAAPAPEPEGSDIVEVYSFNTAVMVALMILWSSFGHLVARKTKYMGEGSAACAMGLITGLAILITQSYFTEEVLHQLLTFQPAGFFTYLLPPIIFYAGLSVKKKQFFRNFVSIASFGILGTYIAFAVIAFVLYGFSKLPNILTLPDCLALGVIFAATDSVAVLQVLKQDKMPLLYSLVFGEGVINDATSVALLRAVQALKGTEVLNASTVVDILIKFLYLFVASMGLGLAFGLGTSWLMKIFKSNSTPQEVALVGLLGYLSYLTGELLGLSGIVTLFCCAVAISHYALHNVSSMSRVTIVNAFQTLSYVSEGAIFIYVGMDMLDPIKWSNTKPVELAWLFCVLLLLMVLGRAAFVFPLSFAHNWWAKERLTVKEMVVIWWSGLIRGAVSVALVYYHFDPAGKSEDSHRATLIATTLIEVMVSIFVFGAATKPLLDYLLGPEASQADDPMATELMAGRRRSQRSDEDRSGGPLYTVVSMAPDDEVVNHVELPEQVHEKSRNASLNSMVESDPDSPLPADSEKLLGSHGQNLSELAENMQPAMAKNPSAKWGPPNGHVNQPWSSGSQAEGNGPAEADFLIDSSNYRPRSQDAGSRASLGSRGSGSNSRLGGSGMSRSQSAPRNRDRWMRLNPSSRQNGQPAWERPVSQSLPSPFEQNSAGEHHARAVADVAEAQRLEDLRNHTAVQRMDSISGGRIHNWWTTFDSRYMQPVFGGAPNNPPPSVELHRRNTRSDQDDSQGQH